MITKGLLAIGLTGALAIGAVAQVQDRTQAKQISMKSGINRMDRNFLKKAYIGGLVEIEGGRIAMRRGQSEWVRNFGSNMVFDHTNADREIKQLAHKSGIDLPQTLDPKHQKLIDRLRNASDAEFDSVYKQFAAATHNEAILLFEKEIKNGHSGNIESLAGTLLPTIKMHRKNIDEKKWMKGHLANGGRR